MVFVADSEAPEQNWTGTLENSDPYPVLKLSDFQIAMRLDHTIDSDRASYELKMAKIHINRQLIGEWKKKKPNRSGKIPAELTSDQSSFYMAAVFHHARAKLLEQYRDVDTTDRGEARADEMSARIKTEWRETRVNIRALVGRSRCTIGLI